MDAISRLPAGVPGSRLRDHVDAGRIRLLTGSSVHAITPAGGRVAVVVRHADGTVESKSYGRVPTFLMATGYEQVRSVVAALAGDWTAARDVQLDLPETGVRSSNAADSSGTDSCCGTSPEPVGKGLATGSSGGLLSAPLNLISLDTPTSGCCAS